MGCCRGAGFLFAIAAAAQEAPHAHQAVFDRVVRAYMQVQGYQVEALVGNQVEPAERRSGDVTVPGAERRTIRVAFRAPNLLRVETNRSTGITSMSPNAGPDQMDNYKGRAEGILAPSGYRDYTAIENDLESARVLRHEDVILSGVPVDCTVVEGRYSYGIRRTFWVDTGRYVVLHEVDLVPGQGSAKGTEAVHTIAVQSLSWNQAPPASLFVAKLKSGIVPPRMIERPPSPAVTPEARLAHLRGVVTMSCTVGTDGRPGDIQVTRSLGMGLDEAAVEWLSRAWFSPAEKDGKLVAMKLISSSMSFSEDSGSMSFNQDTGSDWYLARAEFLPATGVSRPVLSKARYPARHRATGRTIIPLRLTIDKEGNPSDVRAISRGDPKLDQEAVRIVGGWRFQPGQKDGAPVDVAANFDLAFGAADWIVVFPRK